MLPLPIVYDEVAATAADEYADEAPTAGCHHWLQAYNLAQDKSIDLWNVKGRKRTIEAEKDRKNQLAKEAVLASRIEEFEYLLY